MAYTSLFTFPKSAVIKTGVKSLMLSAALPVLLAACQTTGTGVNGDADALTSEPVTISNTRLGNKVERGPHVVRPGQMSVDGGVSQNIEDRPSQIGTVPSVAQASSGIGDNFNSRAPRLNVDTVDAFVSPLSLPQFIDVVFGEMLQIPYVTGPKVAARTDVVQLRSSGTLAAKDFLSLVSEALEDYGVRVVPEDGAYKIIEDSTLRARIPQFIKSRARLSTRGDLRPVIQFVEVEALSAGAVVGLLQEVFGAQRDKLRITADSQNNYVTLSGLSESVNAAIEIIREVDELNFAGAQVRRVSPQFWEASELTEELSKAMRLEGWQVSTDVNRPRTISLLSVEYSNDIFVFAKTDLAHQRVMTWVRELDRPVQGGDSEQIFIYQVKNVDAELLAETLNGVMASSRSSEVQARPALSDAPNASPEASSNLTGATMFTVDKTGNRIVYRGSANAYAQLSKLLDQLDTPAPEVLIEVQIAEVTLTDESSFGVQFFIDDLGNDSVRSTAQTGGLGQGSAGLNVGILTGNIDATLNAFANNRHVKLLSTPTLTARSGGAAQIQVGTDVPVITSQRAANNQNGDGATDILQSVEYRETGVILQIEPIVFGDNRVDLNITQEVSSVLSTANSSTGSPTISNRTVTTEMSLDDGQTAVIGGLIQENRIDSNTGVPLLKDIPILGQAFKTNGVTVNRTELVILITAYVLRGQTDKSRFVNSMQSRVDAFFADEGRLVTLMPRHY